MFSREGTEMKKLIVVFVLAMHVCTLAQDSISVKFSELYNQFRKECGLSTLEYSLELEQFGDERLIASIEGTKECYSYPTSDWEVLCPTKDMHFKFSPMLKQHNADNTKSIVVYTENMAFRGEFYYESMRIRNKSNKNVFTHISKFFSSIFTSDEETNIEYRNAKKEGYEYRIVGYKSMKESDIPSHFFKGWLNSEGHRSNFMIPVLTHFSFSYKRVSINGNPYMVAVWIGGKKKEVKK